MDTTRSIKTNGADIHVLDRPGGGYVIRQGRSHVLLTVREAMDLHTLLGLRLDMATCEPPSHAVRTI